MKIDLHCSQDVGKSEWQDGENCGNHSRHFNAINVKKNA